MSELIPLRNIHSDMPFAAAIREIVVAQLAAVYVWATFLPQPDHAHEHHQMRIAIKRLRYSLDMSQAVIADTAKTSIDDLKAMQAELGKLHDLDVMFLTIHDELAAEEPAKQGKRQEADRARVARQRASLETLLSTTAAARDKQHQHCVSLWEEITARDGFAPLSQAMLALAHVPDTLADTDAPSAKETVSS